MAHFVVTKGDVTLTTSAWSEQDAIEAFYDKTGEDWTSVHDFEVDSIRPATVREAMTAEYGDDWQRRIDHMASVADSHRSTGKAYPDSYEWVPVLVINHTQGRCIHGYEDALTVSNYRVLRDQWADVEGLSDGPYSGSHDIALDLDSEAPADLVEVLESLSDYPVLSDDEYSLVEQEMIQEHWDSYGKSDVLDAVAKAIGQDSRNDLTAAAEDIVTQLVWEGILDYGCGGGYPTMVDVSSCDFGDKEIAEWVKARFGRTVSLQLGPTAVDKVTFDLTRANLVYL